MRIADVAVPVALSLSGFALLTALPGASWAGPDIPDASYEISLPPFEIQIRDYQFPSGLRILFQEEHSQPIVAITNVIDHGSDSDPEGQKGIAHLVEHMNFRARHGDLPKNMDFIKQLGGNFNAYTSWDRTVYMSVAPRDALVPLLRLEALRLTDTLANVTEEDVTVEREVVRNELRQNYENTDNAIGDAWPALSMLLFPPGHPYHISTIGSHEGIDGSDLAACKAFTDAHYRPSEATIVVAGDFSLDEVNDFINQAFGDLPELLVDPDDPDADLTLVESVPRIQGDPPPVPEPHDLGPTTVEGLVDKTTVVVGWTIPAMFYGDDATVQTAVALTQSALIRHLNPDWDPLNDEVTWVGCFPNGGRLASVAGCYIEPRAGQTPEETIEKAKDALYLAWYQADPNEMFGLQIKQIQDWSFRNQKSQAMAGVLRSVDEVASLSGRATSLATHVHYTGSPMFFRDTFQGIQAADVYAAQELARQYLNRDRMAAVIVEPMSDEEKARRKALVATGDEESSYHGEQAESAYELAFDLDDIDAEAIESVTITPDRDRIREFTLDNGLHVAIMPYGEAPLVRVGLYVNGNDSTSEPMGLASLAYDLTVFADRIEPTDDIAQVAGVIYGSDLAMGEQIRVEGASGNLDALLRRMRQEVSRVAWRPAEKNMSIKYARKAFMDAGKKSDAWAARLAAQRAYGADHPLGTWFDTAHYETRRDWTMDMVKQWTWRKYQPANANLVVVGQLDADETEAAVREMFASWEPHDDAGEPLPASMPPFTQQPERSVFLLEREGSNQSEITLTCQAAPVSVDELAAFQVMGDVISERAWRTLREREGLTYGAYAYSNARPGGTASVHGWTLVQADAVGFAVETFLDLLATTAEGEVDEMMLASAKWSRGRRYMLGHQSGSGMLDRLQSVLADGRGLEFFDSYPASLANASTDRFGAFLEPCIGHEVITVVGPVSVAEDKLGELGIAYEVVDWEALHEGQMTPKELKKHKKALEKAEAEEG